MISPRSTGKDPDIKRLSVKDHIQGVITNRDVGRTGVGGLVSSGNTQLNQDGTVGPRPSKVRYGPQPIGKVLGEIFEYKKVTSSASGTTTENWMISMQSYGVSVSPSASLSPSSSISPSSSASTSASASLSPSSSASQSPSSSLSPSASLSASASPSISPSASRSPSSSISPSSSASRSLSPSASVSPSSSTSMSPSSSLSPSSSNSPSSSTSASPSAPTTAYAQIFIARGEDATWTAVTGKYYDDEAKAHFFQIGSKVVIMNGVDTLSYLDIPTAIVTPFTHVNNPSAPTLSANNVGTGSIGTITYRVTCNSTVGETAASNALSTTVDTDRDFWNPPSNGGTDSIVITLPTAPTNALSWNVYMGTVTGYEFLIARGIPISSTTFLDDGSLQQDTTTLYPTINTTDGPKASRGANISGRAYLVGIANDPYTFYWGGDPSFELDFTPVNGGGNQPINKGGKELPVYVGLHRDGQGHSAIKVLCTGTNGKGKRFTLIPDSITFGTQVISFYDVVEDEGEDGTEAPDAVIHYNNSLWYPSRDGIKTTGSLPQLQNVLTTRRVSNTIQPDLKSLNLAAMGGACGLGFEGRLYFGLPVNNNSNNEVWVVDLDRKGAWMKPWSIAADWMWLYNDNTGNTHFMILSNNVMFDMSYASLTTDDGRAFITNGQSGQIYFSDDKRMWVNLLRVIVTLARPQGTINFNITGKTEDADVQTLGEPMSYISTTNQTPAGWSEVTNNYVGWGQNRWSKVTIVPTDSNSDTQEVPIEIDEEVQWAAYAWSTNTTGVDYNISDIVYEYVDVGIKDDA